MASTRPVSIDLLTSSYRMIGTINVTSGGVLALLSDHTCSFIEIRNARMGRIHIANKVAEPAPLMRVLKDHIVAICLDRREDVGPATGLRPGYSRIYKYPIRLSTPVYEIEGTLEWGGRFDFSVIIVDGTSDFVPLFDASLGAILFPSFLLQSAALIFNRRHVSTLMQMNEGS